MYIYVYIYIYLYIYIYAHTHTHTQHNTHTHRFETRAIHAGAAPCATTGARSTPIYQTTAYVFDDADHAASLFNLQVSFDMY